MSSIAFTDGIGAATLQNAMPFPGNRFANWTPDLMELADVEDNLGTGVPSKFLFRSDYVATFEVPYLKATDLAIAMRLKAWLTGGGSCTVTTNDTLGNVYTCTLVAKSTPVIELADAREREYRLKLQLRNSAAAPLLCVY